MRRGSIINKTLMPGSGFHIVYTIIPYLFLKGTDLKSVVQSVWSLEIFPMKDIENNSNKCRTIATLAAAGCQEIDLRLNLLLTRYWVSPKKQQHPFEYIDPDRGDFG